MSSSCSSPFLETGVVMKSSYPNVELPDRSNGTASLLIPLSTKDKDSKNKEENLKLLNGNSGDPADWV